MTYRSFCQPNELLDLLVQDPQSQRVREKEGPHLHEGHEDIQGHLSDTNPTQVFTGIQAAY
jgi:hypothetical protein